MKPTALCRGIRLLLASVALTTLLSGNLAFGQTREEAAVKKAEAVAAKAAADKIAAEKALPAKAAAAKTAAANAAFTAACRAGTSCPTVGAYAAVAAFFIIYITAREGNG